MSHEEHGRLPLDVSARLKMLAAAEAEWRGDHDDEPLPESELRRVIEALALPPAKHVPRVQADKAGPPRE